MWLSCLVILITVDTLWCFQPPIMFMGRPYNGFRSHLFDEEKNASDPIEDNYFSQKLDHFDPTNDQHWNQRYWNNMKYAKSDGPQFFLMGQAAPQYAGVVSSEDLPHMIWAKNISAGVWTLEHRYYGKSQPFEKLTTENMKYLSSRQYLADVANFIETQNQNLNLTNPKWVVFGGSYAGALALWFRELYPNLAVGAVGSSGPIQPVLDFYEFFQFVENSITNHDPKCAENIKVAFEELGNYMEFIAGRQKLDKIFPIDDDLKMLNITSDNIENFYLTVIGHFENAVQYDCGTNCSWGINELCKIVNRNESLLLNLGLIVAALPELSDFNIGKEHKYTDMVDFLKCEETDDFKHAAMRSWVWQTCNEFGFYTTTDGGESFFGSKVTTNFFIDICMDVFGEEYNVDHIKTGIANTLKLYGGNENYYGTNVVAPRGSIDPWSALALKTSNDPSVIPYLIEGGSHCSDMAPPIDGDSESLKNVRELIFQNIKKWIGKYVFYGQRELQKLSGISHIDDTTTTSPATVSSGKQKKPFVSKIKWSHISNFYQHKPQRLSHNYNTHKLLLHQNILRRKFYKNAKFMKVTENTISQPLDHFNKTDEQIWKQRFWNNSVFYQTNGPIFLLIGGEGDEGVWGIDDETTPFMRWAKRYSADTYYIEHRGYGKSLPAEVPTLENLRYISSEQALADIANFIEAINKIRPNSKWITFGGSYPGCLSAWFREKYPELTVGAVASSAPMLPKIDFFEYEQVVENVHYEYNPKCADNFKAAFADLQIMLYSIEGRQVINEMFDSSFEGKSPEISSIQEFLSRMVFHVDGPIQNGASLEDYCTAMTNDSNTPLENLASIEWINYDDEMFSEPIENYTWNADITWTWQTCTEFGWYQSTDMGRNMFGAARPVDYEINSCIQNYGKNISDIAAGIAYTIKNYGGLENYNATNIVFINGSHDPWHAMGLYTNNNNTSPFGITSILINGTAHCGDMLSPQPSDSKQLKETRKKIFYLIKEWLK